MGIKIGKNRIEDFISDATAAALALKQATLVSGTNIKTLNGQSILGSGALTLSVMPAPYLNVLIPDSTLPSTTTNFVLKGAFFTPTMTVSIVGQTINYITFISDNEVDVNVTTGATEGYFAVTLNNGISATFNNALSIVLGSIFTPITADWVSLTGVVTVDNDKIKTATANTSGSATWKIPINININTSIRFVLAYSPFVVSPVGSETVKVELVDSVTGLVQTGVRFRTPTLTSRWYKQDGSFVSTSATQDLYGVPLRFDIIDKIVYLYEGAILKGSDLYVCVNPLWLKVTIHDRDIINIKYIELAS